MLTILLTGGIATGKSTITNYFLKCRICCIDADLIAREQINLLAPELTKFFGPKVLLPNGLVDRAMIRQQIFTDNLVRNRLEKLLHPLIYREMKFRAQKATSPYLIYVVPLFTPQTCPLTYDRLLKITCNTTTQQKRLKERYPEQLSLIPSMLQHQTATTINSVDDLIYNDENLKTLSNTLATLHNLYLQLAKSSILAQRS